MTSTLAARPDRATRRAARPPGVWIDLDGRLWSWLAPLAVTLIGGFLRFWHLGRPPWLVFDETYYVKQGGSFLEYGYERAVREGLKKPDVLWNQGNTDVWGAKADFVVHPPVGKWMIAAGEWLIGVDNPVGWRFASAVVGTLSILMVARIARRLFGSTLLGCTAGLLLAVDGIHFVHSRTGLLDVFVMFWALAAFGCLLADQHAARAHLDRTGTVPLWRPWRLGAALSLGLCIGTKWSGLFFLAAFGLMTVLWDVAARRSAGTRRWALRGVLGDGLLGFVQLVPIALAVYVASWAGWFASSDGYLRGWADGHPASGAARLLPDAVRSLWEYHRQMWGFNTTLTTPHSYQSHPWSWLVMGRPTAFDYRGYQPGERGCGSIECSRAITDLGNPVVWWGGTVALAVLIVVWLLGRDWRAGAILAGMAGGYLPWFLYAHRTIYTFYAVAFVPYVVLALTYVLALVLGPARASADRRLTGAAAAGVVVVLAVMAFAYFYPVLADQLITRDQWSDRMWLPSWI